MVGANKILTVSYGTFSCTLEGFDDSFATMKEIAEYFRDLAAQDRYFGAEPPTPDTEMLTRIAEREAHKPVTATVEDDNVILRVEGASASVHPQPPIEPAEYSEPEIAAPAVNEAASFETISEPAPQAALIEAETVAEKLSRIRAVVARNEFEADTAELGDFSATDEALPSAELQPENDITNTSEFLETSAESAFAEPTTQTLSDEFETIELDTSEPDVSFEPGGDVSPAISGYDEISESERVDDYAQPPLRSIKSELFVPLQDDQSEFFDETYEDDSLDMPSALGTPVSKQSDPSQTSRGRYVLSNTDTEDSAAMERLLKEADTQFSNPETSRRRSAISHLRAAVAATVAERKTVPEASDPKPMEEDAYRADLAEVVRPQKAPAEAKQSNTDVRPATPPLMLVSSQRVDDSEGPNSDESIEISALRDQIRANTQTDHTTIRARLDSDEADEHDDENIFASDASFVNFVTATGASELVDLLEAAAAYTRFVEGVPQFKRPRIMALVAGYTGKDTHSREEGLRAFGVLLREGRFEKVKRGYFQIADSTRFRPHTRAAGE